MLIKRGTTRITLILGNWAIKIPILNRSLKHFVKGWLGNIDERNIWRKTKHTQLCPIYFSVFGLINVMPRAIPIYETLWKFDKQWAFRTFNNVPVDLDVCSGWKNFGYVNGSIVVLDYAVCRESSEFCSDCDNNCILK